jgi:riboflavin biosynthesis pyrimidine reductase
MPSRALERPLDVLHEVEGLPKFELPEELRRLYGGDLGFEQPRLYTNFVSTLDGVVAIPSIPRSNDVIAAGSAGDRFVMGLLRAFADVVLIGSGTLRDSPQGTWRPDKVYPPARDAFAELRRALGRAENPTIAIVSGSGGIDVEHPVLASGAVVLTTNAGATRLEGRLPAGATAIVLGSGAVIDPPRIVSALHDLGHRLILSEAGPHTFGSFLEAGVIDELFQTISPMLVGDGGPDSRLRLVEGRDLMPSGIRARLLSLRREDAHLFARYELVG